jgi:hypothetical protein
MEILRSKKFLLLIILGFTYSTIVMAQEANTDKGWNFQIGPDFYAPLVSGDVIMGNNSGTLTSSLNYGGMLGFEAYSAKWAIGTNLLFVSTSSDLTLPLTNRPANFEGKFTLIGIYGLRQATKWFDIGLGGRIVLVDADLFIDGAQIKNSQYPAFAPLIDYRFNILDSEKWGITLQGDVGGFGIGSTWTYLVNPYVSFRISKLFGLYAGYRLLSFSTTSDSEKTEMDILMHGPKLGVFIHF